MKPRIWILDQIAACIKMVPMNLEHAPGLRPQLDVVWDLVLEVNPDRSPCKYVRHQVHAMWGNKNHAKVDIIELVVP